MIKYQYTITVISDKTRTYECRHSLDVFDWIGRIDNNMYRHFGKNWLRNVTVRIDGKISRDFYDRETLLDFANKMMKDYYHKGA